MLTFIDQFMGVVDVIMTWNFDQVPPFWYSYILRLKNDGFNI
jgi:hypothetical protein